MSLLNSVQSAILTFAHTGVMARSERRDGYEAPRVVSEDGRRFDVEDRARSLRAAKRFTAGES